jgi:hypothetical protein
VLGLISVTVKFGGTLSANLTVIFMRFGLQLGVERHKFRLEFQAGQLICQAFVQFFTTSGQIFYQMSRHKLLKSRCFLLYALLSLRTVITTIFVNNTLHGMVQFSLKYSFYRPENVTMSCQ